MSRWRPKRLYIPFITVIALFTVSLGFSLHNTLRQEALGQIELTHLLWAATQLEVEHYRFLDALERYALADEEPDKRSLMKRFDVLWSRPPVLMTGAGGTRFRAVEGAEDLVNRYQRALREVEFGLEMLQPGDRAAFGAIHDRLSVFSLPIHHVVRKTFHATDQATLFRNRELGEAYIFLVLSLLGVMLSGAMLVVIVIRQERKARLAEESALEARRQAETASRAKGHFLANMSHELRTPLNAIVGFAEVICLETFGPVENARYREYIEDIHASANLLLGIIGDILDTAKIEAGKLELEEEVVDLAASVESALRILRPHASDGGVALAAGVPSDFPSLRADRRLIRQMVLNLVSNAIKFTPPGGQVKVAAELDSAGRIVLRVRDTGMGMTDEQVATALSPYGQVDSGTRRNRGGTGLGLPLAKSFAELHSAIFDLHSAPGEGTLAVIRFPLERRMGRVSAA